MTYQIFDSETQIHKSHRRTANPFHPDNFVVARGSKVEGDAQCSAVFYKGKTADNYLVIPDNVDVIVGHNIKFDLLYEMTNYSPSLKAFYKRGGKIWCTQYAHYLLNAQDRRTHMNSMDQIIEQYGGRKKIDGMKALWAAGVQTADIDRAMVLDYLIGTVEEERNSGDIGNTELIYLGQIKAAAKNNMLHTIQVRMDGLAATTDMEFNGIRVDVARAKSDLVRLSAELVTANAELDTYLTDMPDGLVFSWGSPTHKSCLIYGGTIRYEQSAHYIDENTGQLARLKATEKWPLFDKVALSPKAGGIVLSEGVYYDRAGGLNTAQDTFLSGQKLGEPKFKNMPVPGELKSRITDFFHTLPGYVNPDDLEIDRGAMKDGKGGPTYSTDKDTCILLGNLDVPFLKVMGKKTALDKEIGTYYFTVGKDGTPKGMLTCVQPSDHVIHHALNHTSTVTSRLSASNPNMQNIPRGDKSTIKAMFVSRFEGGKMAEIDYSQLEVVVMGFLSGDPQLVADLLSKVDFHCVRVAAREGCTYEEAKEWCKNEDHIKHAVWKVFRTECKVFSFQRAYGAGASTIALSANMSIVTVKDMIEKEERMYPIVEKFHIGVEAEINATAEAFRDPERGYRVYRRGTWQAPTGTLYGWRSWDAPKFMRERGIMDTFSPPEIKNYPTQGTGGEIVQMVLGVLWRMFIKTDNWGGKAFLVNTVHDCVWFDLHPDVADEVLGVVKHIMENVQALLKHFYNIDCPVPFPVDVEIGDNMLELKHWKPKEGS
jgi:DNA polymerase-1